MGKMLNLILKRKTRFKKPLPFEVVRENGAEKKSNYKSWKESSWSIRFFCTYTRTSQHICTVGLSLGLKSFHPTCVYNFHKKLIFGTVRTVESEQFWRFTKRRILTKNQQNVEPVFKETSHIHMLKTHVSVHDTVPLKRLLCIDYCCSKLTYILVCAISSNPSNS